MDLSQYAELFLAEAREHLSACNQLLLEWERNPTNPGPVGGLFRAVHTVKGMAATMGYAGVTDVAHRIESLLDLFRRGAHPASGKCFSCCSARGMRCSRRSSSRSRAASGSS